MAEEAHVEAPKWIYDEVVPAVGSRVRSLHLLKQTGARKSVLLFAEGAALVAEKGLLSGVKVYRVDYPRGLLLNESNCPHCGKMIQEPVGKVAHLAKNGKGKKAAPKKADPPSGEGGMTPKQEAAVAYARDMKTLRARAAQAKGGKGPIAQRESARQLRKKHGIE